MAKTPPSIASEQIKAVMAELDLRYKLMVYAVDTFAKTEAQVDALMYVRGGMDPRYAAPADRDAYLRVLLKAGSPVAVAAFLRGWATHHDTGPVEPFAWHRMIAGRKVQVSFG